MKEIGGLGTKLDGASGFRIDHSNYEEQDRAGVENANLENSFTVLFTADAVVCSEYARFFARHLRDPFSVALILDFPMRRL